MPNLIQSGFVTLKATLLIGALIATSVTVLVARSGATSADLDTNVCVAASWKANTLINSNYGDCPDAPVITPTANPIVTPVISVSPTSPVETPTPTPTVVPTISPDPNPEPTVAPTPTETATTAPEPTLVPTPTASPTPTPTHTPDVTVSPTPVATAPVVPPAPDPIPIPPANLDPKTKEFMFCHGGAMHSNSFTGMMNGHHDRHADDIIPPIPFKFYGGWNWTATNAKTYYNNCIPVN